MRDANPKTIYLRDYTPPEYLIETVDLSFHLEPHATRVVNRLKLIRNPDSDSSSTDLELNGESMALLSVRVDGAVQGPADYRQHEDGLVLHGVPADRWFEVEVETRISPAENTALEGLYLSNGMFCTQCEAEGFRRITYFLDRPDVMSVFTTTLVADRDLYPVLLANGNRVAEGVCEDNRHWVTWKDPFKKPCYLFALVAGKLDVLQDAFVTCNGRRIDLEIYVDQKDLDKCDHAMASLKNAMEWDEQVFGREYDLDLYMIVAVGHFNMGAMENKGLNIFNTKYVLARADTATDTDYEQIEAVIGHEYFHNWSGNRVTCRDWFQLSLKEGLTVFRDQQFTADRTSAGVKRINDVNMLRSHQFAEDGGPMAHPVRPDSYMEINNFYTLTVYEKGAEVVRMIHTLTGSGGFRKGMDLYFQRYDGQAVTTDDFVGAMEDANGLDLAQFKLWYSQAGTPQLAISEEYDSAAGSLRLRMTQSCPSTPGQAQKQPMHIPVRIALLGSGGQLLNTELEGSTGTERVLELREPAQDFCFSGLGERPVVSVLRGFSAPVKLDMEREAADLVFLLSYDSDPFSRWEAGQQLALRILTGYIREGHNSTASDGATPLLLQAFARLLDNPPDDRSLLALLLGLPSEKYLAQQMTVVDVDAIYSARERLKKAIALEFCDRFRKIYQQNHEENGGEQATGGAGRRKLKNVCLDYLTCLDSEEVFGLADSQYRNAANMTDQIASLGCIINSSNPAREEFLADFYRRWQEDPLVIDKWFTLQASSPDYGTLETIAALRAHPAFDIRNPNRVRSLVGAFSQANSLRFHAADGGGYEFLADRVIELDPINPQVASRMIGAFTQWRRFDEHRQGLMKAQLSKILASTNLSRDVYEVAKKSLDS